MIDYELVGKILQQINLKEHPQFDDPDERICYLIQETWNCAIEHAQKEVKAQINSVLRKS
jgi:hypothetical protein